MDRLRRRNNPLLAINNTALPSDNTRVVLPYQAKSQGPRVLRTNTADTSRRFERMKRAAIIQREEAEEREAEEERKRIQAAREIEARRQERERIDNNIANYKKKQEKRQREYEENKAEIEAAAKKEKELKDKYYERDYREWKEDVDKNPDEYNPLTRAIVSLTKNVSVKGISPFSPYARLLFGLKNMAGTVSTNSIETNGTRYQGEISLRQHMLDAAQVHKNRVELQQYKQNLSELLEDFVPGSKEYNDIRNTMDQVDIKLADPESKKFDDDYKQNYVINKSSLWGLAKKAYRNWMSSMAYDQYKDYVAKRDYQEDVNQYYEMLVDQQNKSKEDKNGTDNLYKRVDPQKWAQLQKERAKRTLQSYTPKELIALDNERTNARIDELNQEVGKYRDLYAQNRQHLAESEKYWQVSEYFKHGIKAHQNDPLTSLGYWGYAIYPMIGSTFSSPEQAVSMAAQLGSGAAYASTPYTGGAGAVVGAGLGVASGYYGLLSGFAENTTEAGDKRIDNFKEILSQSGDLKRTVAELIDRSGQYWRNKGWSEEDINKYLKGEEGVNHAINDYFTGLTKSLVDENGNPYVFDQSGENSLYTNPLSNPAVHKAELYSTQGLNALYDADNARTVFSNLFQTVVSVTPTGSIRKQASMYIDKLAPRYISKDVGYKTISDAAGRVTAESATHATAKEAAKRAAGETYSNGFRKKTLSQSMKAGYKRGAAIGEMAGFGVVGEVFGGAVGAGLNLSARIGVEKMPVRAQNLFRSIEEGVMHKYQHVYDKLLKDRKFAQAAAIYGARMAKNTAASMMSEAAEEGVQYLNSKENYAEKYGWSGMPIGDMIFNDVYQGARVFNSYGALLGITESDLLNDAEYWANIQGGFALGGLQTGTVRLGVEGWNAYREIPVHGAILESAVMNRELDKKDRAANVEFARQAMRKRSNETLEVLDWMERDDRHREEPMFTQEDYDEKRKAVQRINQMVDNKTIRGKLEAKGFVYGTEEYANAIADIYSIEDARRKNREEAADKQNSINGLYNTKEYQEEADALVQSMFDSSFEETIGKQAAIIEAGNKAVADEIASAKEAGEDTSTSDFKRHLQNIRKDAQESAEQQLKLQYRNNVLETSHVAHKLRSLINLRAQHNTINDFFNYIQDKFNLKPKRGDASLITKNVDNQIKEAKEQLHELNSEFDVEFSDKAALDFIEQLSIVKAHSEDLEAHEIAAAMIQADADIITKHGQMFEEGLVKTKDGKWQYNPKQYKSNIAHRKALFEKMLGKEITEEEFKNQLDNNPTVEPYDESQVKNNPYARRIKAIIDARKDDDSLEYMMRDIEHGDGVVKILNELEKENSAENVSENNAEEAKVASETLEFERGESSSTEAPEITIEQPAQQEQPRVQTPKEKYEARKKKAQESYKNRKKTLRDLRKRAFASIIPIPTPLLDLANYLIVKGQIGTYKIAQFAEELKNAAKAKGFNANEFLSGIKAFYIDNVTNLMAENPDLMENFSSPKEIVDFHFGDDLEIKQPVTTGSVQFMQDQINEETAKINEALSTHYDIVINVGNTVEVYPNREAIVNARFEQNVVWQNIIDQLNSKLNDEPAYREYITKLFERFPNAPVEDYVKYRNVENMSQVIANNRCTQEFEESVQNGKRIRNAVVSIMLGREDQIDPSYFVGDYEYFRNQILQLKEQLTSKTNGKGLTILDTAVPIYGNDYNGKKISSEADIIATDGTNIYVIDVRYSFESPREYWNIKFPKATFTIGEHVTRRVKQIEQIINTKFKRPVNGLYCLPIIYNPHDELLTVDHGSNGEMLKAIKPESTINPSDNADELKETSGILVNNINAIIDEYNTVAEEARKYSDLYGEIENIVAQTFESAQEYSDYISNLHAQYDTLQDRIDEMKTLINKQSNIYNEALNQQILTLSNQNEPSYNIQLGILKDACADLDVLINMLPELPITTDTERNNVDAFIDGLFKAQIALDDLLNNKDAKYSDIRAEQELISIAIEKLTKNEQVYGKQAIFAKKWWATQFAVGIQGNDTETVKTENEMMFGYINRINSWIGTLQDHVLSQLQDDVRLQQWYSSLLNNYFNTLLNNAELFANNVLQDAAQKQYMINTVNKGRDLIDQFNGVWDTRPDETYSGPSFSPEVDQINKMPVKWKDLYGFTDSIMPSIDQMSDNKGVGRFYYYLSTSPNFLDSKFILSQRRDGKLQIYIEGVTKDGQTRNVTLTFENDITKARPEDVERWEYLNHAKQKFIRKAIAALNFVKDNPGYEVRFDKKTNKGQILYNEDGELSSVEEWMFKDGANKHDLYTIKLSKDSRVGILVRLEGDGVAPDTYIVRGGDNLMDDIGGFDRDYQKQKIHIQNGALVYFYNTGNDQYIGIPIQSQPIGKDTAVKLVELIQKYIAGDRIDQYGYNIMDLLKMRLYMADPERKLSRRNNVSNMITIENGNVTIGEQTFDVVSNKQALIDRIASMQNVTRATMLNQYMRQSNNSVLSRVRTLFGNSDYNSVQLTNGLVFTRDDFSHHNEGANVQDGSTWLGYMLRNNMLGTSAKALGYKELRISNIRVVPKGFQEEPTVKQEVQQATKKPKIVVKTNDFFDKLAGLRKIVEESEMDANRSVEQQESFMHDVMSYFDSVLGKNGKVEFSRTDEIFLGQISKNERIAGICTTQAIRLSRYAPMSVAWHEAFHKIFELAIPAKERDKFYKAYRWGRVSEKSDRVVAEAFGDMFIQYMQNKQAINKADGFFKKIIPWIKSFGFGFGMIFKIGPHRAKQMFDLYHNINKGVYKDTEITKEQNERFKKLFGEGLYYTVTNTDNKHSAEFSHIADIGDRDKLVRGLSYFILRSFGIDELNPNVARVKITGGTSKMKSTVDRLAEMNDGTIIEYLKNQHPVFEEVFEKVEKTHTTEDGKVVTYNYYPKFDALSRHIADYISSVFDTMRKPKIEEDDTKTQTDVQEDNGESIDFRAADTDHWDKASYEFSKLDGLMDEVKLFFGTIPYAVYQDDVDEDGNAVRSVVVDYNRNKYGCPEFRPAEEVWSLMVNKFHKASTIEELDQMLEEYAGTKEIYAQVYQKFHKLIDGIYKKNDDGVVIVAQTNFDKEQLAIQILSAIQSQKNIFLVALSQKQDKQEEEGKSIRVVESSMDRDSRLYPDQWNRYLVSGQIGVFQRERGEGNVIDAQGRKKKTVLLFRNGMGGTNGSDIFSRTAKFFSDLRTSMLSNVSEVTVDGVNYNLHIFDDVSRIKDEIIHRLNTIGIMFERDALDYMLSELYGGTDAESVTAFLNDSPVSDDRNVIESEKKSTLQSFINRINSYVQDNGTINQDFIEKEGYSKIGFVNKLANWQGRYKRISSQNMAYALNGKKLYSISQNNTVSHIVKQLNTLDDENATIKVLSRFGYNITRDELGAPIGSIIMKAIANKKPLDMNTYTYIGFKTDNKGDQGSEYTDESTIEDYMAKMTMLQQGYLIFPTLADKGTWMVLDNVPIPGIKFIQLANDENGELQQMIVDKAPRVRIIDGKPYLIPDDSVIDQMLEYAKTELLAIQQCMEDLGYENIPGYQKAGRKVLSESEKILNYHTPNKNIEPNGTRFLSLTAVTTYDYNKSKNKWELNTHNLNDPREDSVTLLQRAIDNFFGRRNGESVEDMIKRQRETMALTLAVQTQNEVNTAVSLGLVQKIDYSAKFGNNVVKVSSEDTNLINLDSKDLNTLQVQALQKHIMDTTRKKNGILWKDVKDNQQRAFYSKMARSLAIAAILQDATNRHIICSQEVQRCFSGHPALFKVKYSKTGIADSAYDIQKRIGGLVSTGEDNITTLPGLKQTYICAECNDYEVESKSNVAVRLQDMFSESNARYTYGCITSDWGGAYTKPIDEIIKVAVVNKAYNRGKDYAESFTGGINVADGASYITADMCRDMLRMRGAYNNKVRKAFKVLMGSDKYSWIKSKEAYKTVYEALNIVPTKYTAYGFRSHTLNGSQVSDVAVAYYNKFALFPIFPCMATGKMEGIYQKMIDEGVDMLLMTSAVKVGSQGAVSYDGNGISEPFNKYEQDYSYLRRQLNTDPEENDETHIGTQMIKIGLSNLVQERTYKDLDGNDISGKEILDNMMSSINGLAEIGAQEIRDMFMTTEEEVDGNGEIVASVQRIDYKKMSEYLNDQLTSRNANKTIIQAIQTTADGNKLASPLAATPDAAWIESIFISTMNKHIVDITTPGKSFVQRSIWAMEGDSNMSKSLNRGQKLQMINEEHSMDAVISIDYFESMLPKNLSFEEAKQWLVNNGIISGYRDGQWVDAEAIMIGYRIPTQAQPSIHALRIVDVIPATKTTIILPEEFTKITGSDFDIDHLYLASFNFHEGQDGKLTRQFDVNTKEWHQNRILESLMILLKDTENSLNHLYKPIDNDTELVTAVSDYIEEQGSTKDSPYNFGTLHEQVIRKNDYITGKKGIAPFALNSTGHVLCRQYGVKFKDTKLVANTRLSDFDERLDKDGNPIESWLSGFINAHVDIVKDPYISRLNVNPFTYNMLNLMIRCGWGDTSLWFLANPIIRSMAQANDLADSQYIRRPNKNKTGRTYREELIYNAVKQYLDENEISEEKLNWLLNDKGASDYRIHYINALDEMQDKLKECAITGKVDHSTALAVFYAWKILEKYSRGLGNLVQHTKVDTRKYGKNFIAVQKYYSDYKKLFRPFGEDALLSIWDVDSLAYFENSSWMATKTDLVSTIPLQIFGGQTFNANPRFVKAVINFAKTLERGGKELSADDVVQLSRHLQTAIKSKYFVQYAHDVLNMSDKDIADLFIGYKSMNRQLVSLKDLIANDPRYKRLETNPFLNQIYSMLEDRPVLANGREMSDRPAFVTVLDNVDDSKLNSDLLSEGWFDLMNDEDKRVRTFAKKMVLYSFFSSGEFKGWNKLLKYVPYEWIAGQVDSQYKSYSSFIEEELRHVADDYSDLYDDIVANNFMDYRFAEQTDGTNEDGSLQFLNNDRGVKIGKGVSKDQLDDVSEYISIKRKGMRSGHQDSYELYKLIDTVKYSKFYYPVYAKIKKRGYHTRGNDIYEYGWDFNYAENEMKGSDTFDYESAIQRVKDYVSSGELDGFSNANIIAINKVFVGAEVSENKAPKQKQIEPGAHIATRGYKKGDPQKHPEFNYVFTENAQAYLRSLLVNSDEESKRFTNPDAESKKDSGLPSSVFTEVNPAPYVKLKVSDVNGTNQAGIRTDEKGNLTENAYGIIVKKNQQDIQGNFISQEGTFQDTNEDFELFTKLNSHMFDRLESSSNKVIVFPQQMALNRSALPKRFAEWLQTQLLDRFGVVSELAKNERSDYDGYGLKLLEVVPKESNLRQSRQYDWKYEEDSGYSGVLEELGLPEKVRMNGHMTYRPHYKFGRIYLTDDEKQHVHEKITAVVQGTEYSSEDIDRISEFYDSGKFNIDTFGEESKSDEKSDEDKIPVPKEYEDQINMLYDYHMISEKDFDGPGEKISKRAIEYTKFLIDNNLLNVMEDLLCIFGELGLSDSEVFRYEFKDLLYDYMSNFDDADLIDERDNIQYSYTDDRQLELFSDEDVDYKYMNHCKQ